jgi:hypothetical protein
MATSRTASQVQARLTIKPIKVEAPELAYAIRLIRQVCCLAGSSDLIERFVDQDLCSAIDRRDTAALYDRLIYSLSFQGISDETAENYMRRHGRPTWAVIRNNLDRRPTCPKLKTYWHFYDCRYEKTNHTCGEPSHIGTCPVPTHRLRNGHLNQLAYSLYLFIRDVADGDIVSWIDDRLDQANDPTVPDGFGKAQNALIDPLRNVYGVSDKVLTMALSGILIGAADARPRWLEVGVALIAVDTLVHNFLHRTGILARFNAAHAYGLRCYQSGGCADIIQAVAGQIDARQFNRSFPKVFPRFVQHAIWRYCNQQGLDICNGNRLDDRHRCQNRHCRLYGICDRIRLKKTK